jgi:hypothetical protein
MVSFYFKEKNYSFIGVKEQLQGTTRRSKQQIFSRLFFVRELSAAPGLLDK